MIVRKQLHELLELILALLAGWSKKFLNYLEYRYYVPFLRLAELRNEQYRCSQQTFRGVVEIGVLSEGGGIHAGEDDRLRYDLGVLLGLCLIHEHIGMRLIKIHVFIDEMQKIVSVGACGISQIDYGYVVAIALCDIAVVSHNIAFGVCGEEAHSACAGVLNTGVKPERGLAYACRADHKDMDIARIDHRSGVAFAADDYALRQRLAVIVRGRVPILRLLAPFIGRERNMPINLLLFTLRHPAGRTVLTVANGPGLDAVEAVNIRKQGYAAEHGEH